ncbi:glutamate racemase [Candidatus Saccharibacteria bacterium]|nr:glutamate racemase [Candidatus Saccharibacteria bacterium]
MATMKIGVFDSGLGGLVIAHALVSKMPQYDYVYLGDTARAPYGDKSKPAILANTMQGMEVLFKKDCKLVIVACNSASADALRKIQQEFIPAHWPDRKALGVLIPSAEAAVRDGKRVGVICTQATADSGAFNREINKLSNSVQVFHKSAPMLVENIEKGEQKEAHKNLSRYLSDLTAQGIDTLILGCTHYPLLKNKISELVGKGVNVISQDEIIPAKLQDYLARHSEIVGDLSTSASIEFYVSKITPTSQRLANKLFGQSVELEQIVIDGQYGG